MSIIVGVDPGFTGAVACIDADSGYVRDLFDIPTIDFRGRTEIDTEDLRHRFSAPLFDDVRHTYLEWPSTRPNESAERSKRFGVGLGILEALCGDFSTVVRVPPATWKRAYGLAGKKKNTKAVKEATVKMAIEETGVSREWLTGPKGGIKDGRADALLIAAYGGWCEHG